MSDLDTAGTPALRFPAPRHAAAPLVTVRALPPSAGALDEPIPGLVALGPVASERKARDWALVLQSMSIWHVIRRANAGWVLLVNDADYPTASGSIDRYEAENRDWPPRRTRERSRHPTSSLIPAVFLVLAAFLLVTGPASANSVWFERGVAVSSQVLGSQPWRAVTALTLHADAVHAMGNAISGTVFVSALQRRIGTGGAVLATLASGIAGNVANAVYHQVTVGHHASLGASTAIFGAIGLLAATQLVLDRPAVKRARPWTEIAGPIVGGFALLGALGAGGERTDLGAHFFGLVAGVVIGLVVAFPLRRATLAVDVATGHHGHEVALGSGAPRWWVQASLGTFAAAIIMVSWQLALRFGA
jgi:membrane associated rhomboid family serine protease